MRLLDLVIEGYQVPVEHPEWALRDDWEPTPENPNVTILNTTERVALEVWLNVPGMKPQKVDRNFSLDTPHETPLWIGRAARAPYVVQAFNEIVHKANSRYGGQFDPWAHLR